MADCFPAGLCKLIVLVTIYACELVPLHIVITDIGAGGTDSGLYRSSYRFVSSAVYLIRNIEEGCVNDLFLLSALHPAEGAQPYLCSVHPDGRNCDLDRFALATDRSCSLGNFSFAEAKRPFRKNLSLIIFDVVLMGSAEYRIPLGAYVHRPDCSVLLSEKTAKSRRGGSH